MKTAAFDVECQGDVLEGDLELLVELVVLRLARDCVLGRNPRVLQLDLVLEVGLGRDLDRFERLRLVLVHSVESGLVLEGLLVVAGLVEGLVGVPRLVHHHHLVPSTRSPAGGIQGLSDKPE